MQKKILIVEDNQDIVFILRRRLENIGFSVDAAENGYSVLGYLKNDLTPDAIILDLILPQRNGIELLCSIKSKWPETKVFIFTAHSEYEEQMPLYEKYINGFFCKSEGMDRLMEAVQKEL
jgi:DNA-binding NtrC family response regulator